MSTGMQPRPRADIAAANRASFARWTKAAVVFAVGLGLLGAAIWVATRDRERFAQALEAIARAPWWAVALALLLYLLNFVFASASFWVLTNRYGRVRFGEMFALIAGATLFNYLPLRPGMIARVAYHKAVHRIQVRDSLRVLLAAVCCAGAAMLALLLAAWAAHSSTGGIGWAAAIMSAPGVIAALAAMALCRRGASHRWRWPAAGAFRYLDMCVWTARYALIFWLLGRPMSPPTAAAVAFSSQAAMLTPVQLGLREWVVGATVGALSGDAHGRGLQLPATLAALAPGLLADVINRAIELCVAIPLGIAGTLILSARFRRAAPANSLNPIAPPAL